jgi:hypothetical protein
VVFGCNASKNNDISQKDVSKEINDFVFYLDDVTGLYPEAISRYRDQYFNLYAYRSKEDIFCSLHYTCIFLR